MIKGVTQETSVYNIYYWLKEIKIFLIGLEMFKYKWLFLEGFFFPANSVFGWYILMLDGFFFFVVQVAVDSFKQ